MTTLLVAILAFMLGWVLGGAFVCRAYENNRVPAFVRERREVLLQLNKKSFSGRFYEATPESLRKAANKN